jgi:hypothetical protein
MKWRQRIPALVGLTALTAMSVLGIAGQAGAGVAPETNSQAVSRGVVVTTERTVSAPTMSSATSGCRTYKYTAKLNEWPGWPEDAWYEMDTYFCWNGVIVTYHSTSTKYGTTVVGKAEGWQFDGQGELGFHCYVAVGSTRNCSGNTEYRQGHFSLCVPQVGCRVGWDPTIQEWENYHGGAGVWT